MSPLKSVWKLAEEDHAKLGKVKDATNAYPATGRWILQREEYKNFKEGVSQLRLLWVKGPRECWIPKRFMKQRLNVVSIAGVGKTVIRYGPTT